MIVIIDNTNDKETPYLRLLVLANPREEKKEIKRRRRQGNISFLLLDKIKHKNKENQMKKALISLLGLFKRYDNILVNT